MRSAKFWKCAKRTKQILVSTQFTSNWDFARGIMNRWLPVHILHAISISSQQIEPSNQYLSSLDILVSSLLFVGWHYLLLAFKAWRDSSKMARSLVAMFLSTRNQTIVHYVSEVSLELRDIGIKNVVVPSTLFSYLHFAFKSSDRLSFIKPRLFKDRHPRCLELSDEIPRRC